MKVEIANQGSHSGLAGGILPDTWRIINLLISRLEDPQTGEVVKDLHVEIPDYFLEEAKQIAEHQGELLYKGFGTAIPTLEPINKENYAEMYLNGRWRPCLTVTGIDDIPPTTKAGNVIRKSTTVKISIRLPPLLNSDKAYEIIRDILLKDPIPYGAKVTISNVSKGTGFCSKPMTEKLKQSIDSANKHVFGSTPKSFGIGFSIPFLAALGQKFPDAQILALGVGHQETNPHNPNEFINIKYLESIIKVLAHTLGDLGNN